MPTAQSTGREIRNFTRDPSLASDVADQFGGGAGNAEALIASWELRITPELEAAMLLPADKSQPEIDHADIADAADLPEESILGYTKHGNYLSYVFEVSDRVVKDALLIEADGSLTLPESSKDSPQRQALAAAAEARKTILSAEEEAAEILAKAREEAERLVTEAAQDSREQQRDAQIEAAKSVGGDRDAQAKKAAAKQASGTDRSPGKQQDASHKPS